MTLLFDYHWRRHHMCVNLILPHIWDVSGFAFKTGYDSPPIYMLVFTLSFFSNCPWLYLVFILCFHYRETYISSCLPFVEHDSSTQHLRDLMTTNMNKFYFLCKYLFTSGTYMIGLPKLWLLALMIKQSARHASFFKMFELTDYL